MAKQYEISVNDQLLPEIDSLKSAGKELTGSVQTQGESELPASVEYRKRCHEVAKIMKMFDNLIQHDTAQLNTFVKAMKTADSQK